MATIDPLLIDIAPLHSARLLLRAPSAGDGAALNEAMVESIESLTPWMPWAQTLPTPEQSELTCRQMAARFAQRSDLPMFIFERGDGAGAGRLSAARGLHRIDWSVPRFEIGYWCRTGMQGRGFVTEAVQTLLRFAFDSLRARRVEVRMSSANTAQPRRRRTLRLHARRGAAAGLARCRRRAARHRGVCARAWRRGARLTQRARFGSPGPRRSTASVTMPSMPSAISSSARCGVVHRVDQRAPPGAVDLRRSSAASISLWLVMIATQSSAAAISMQPGHTLSSSSARGSSGAAVARAVERLRA